MAIKAQTEICSYLPKVGSRGSAGGKGAEPPENFSGFTCPRLQEIITESRKLLIMTDRDVCITLLKHEEIQKCFSAAYPYIIGKPCSLSLFHVLDW